jgi:CRP-like cAMP-binding protein
MLRSVPMLGQLTLEPLIALAHRMQIQIFGQGQTIFQQGDHGEALYLIARRQVRIYCSSALGRELTVAIFRAHDFFGELALLDDRPYSASAVANVPHDYVAAAAHGVPPAPTRSAGDYRDPAG